MDNLRKKIEQLKPGEMVVHSVGAGLCIGLLILAIDGYGRSNGWW